MPQIYGLCLPQCNILFKLLHQQPTLDFMNMLTATDKSARNALRFKEVAGLDDYCARYFTTRV